MRRSIRSVRNADFVGAFALAPLLRAVRVPDGHANDRDRRVHAAVRNHPRNAPPGADDHPPADLLAQDPVRRAHVVRSLGRHRRRLQPEAVLADRSRPVVHDLVVGRAPLLEREIEALEPELEPDHVRLEHPQRLLEELLAGLVPFQDDDGLRCHESDPTAVGTRLAWHEQEAGGATGARVAFAITTRAGSRSRIADKVARIEALVIPPAWKDVWISPRAGAKLQATGVDKAGRRQYLYHPEFRARQEQEKFDKLVRFAERLPDLRKAMSKDMDGDPLSPEWVCALALRLINLGWFRVGTERYARTTRTFGITTLRKGHVSVRGSRITFKYRGKHRVLVRTAIVDADLADAMRELLQLPGGRRLFRYELPDGTFCNLTRREAERLHRRAHGRRIHRQGFPHLGRHADRRDRVRRARSRGDGNRGQESRRRSDARGRREAREYPCRCAIVICQSCGRRAVSRRKNHRRFQTSPFARSGRARYETRSRRTGARQLVAFVANSPRATCRVNSSRLSDTLPRSR